ncbi:MAG: c-type cytochrome [Gemmatimonadales bacterium]
MLHEHSARAGRPAPAARTRFNSPVGVAGLVLFGLATAALVVSCGDSSSGTSAPVLVQLDSNLVRQGKSIFRFSTFNDEHFWTDTARMHEVVATSVSPALALQVGLKVDADTLPQGVKDAIAAGQVDLNSPATTVTLLKLGAVLGLKGTVQTVNGKDSLVSLGITCALCHSTVDNSFAPGIGHRLDGFPNHDLNVGAIIALSPAISPALKSILQSWGPGKYDPRTNFDGKNDPAVIPPAYGLNGVAKEIYTGDDTISYWNAYVAITQMHGQGTFIDSRLGISVHNGPEVVAPLLPALLQYQLSLRAPAAPAGSFDAAAAARGKALFDGAARCSTCHVGALFTDVNEGKLHTAAEVGQSADYASRSVTKKYRTTPLRGLQQHPPYFHDGSAATLEDVVAHYNTLMKLGLTAQQRTDLVQYLKTL